MEPGPLRDLATFAAGVLTGILSAAFGVGGAVVSTPAIRAIGVTAALAVGTTLPSVLPSAITGTLRYVRAGLVVPRVVAWTAPFGIVASVAGSVLSKVVPGDGHLLMIATALLLGFVAVRMLRQPRRAAVSGAAESQDDAATAAGDPSRWVLAGVGVGAGMLSGLLGLGGGVVMVPGFTELARIPLKRAIATSLACVGLFAIPGTITHALLDGIDWRVALFLSLGVVPGARIGAALALRATATALRLAVAAFLGAIAVAYLIGEAAALL